MNAKLFWLIHNERPYARYYYEPKEGLKSSLLYEIKEYKNLLLSAVCLPWNKKFNHQQFPGERKSKFKMAIENLLWAIKYKELCTYYFLYGLDLKGHDPKEYVGYTEFRVMRNIINIRQWENKKTLYTFNYLALVRDKFVFYQYCKSLGIPFPRLIALISNRKVSWYDGQKMVWSDIESIKDKDFSGFCKETKGESGIGAFVLDVKDGKISISGKPSTLEDLMEKIGNATYIIQERLKNHSELDKIYPHSLNTLKLQTMLNSDGSVSFFSAIQRFGANGSFIDNGASGGIIVGVNEQGFLNDFGFQEPHTGNEQLIIHGIHPNTQQKFAGMKLPYWDEIIETAKTFHKFLYGIPSICWDVAMTENGICFTEGGEDWEIAANQAALGPLREKFYKFHGYALDIKLRKY